MNYKNNDFKTFSDIEYTRPEFEKLRAFYEEMSARVNNAKSYEEVKAYILEEEEFSK